MGASDLVSMRSSLDGHQHWLTSLAFDEGVIERHGQYRALCGDTVFACAMAAPPGPQCSRCEVARLARRAHQSPAPKSRHQLRTPWMQRCR